MGVFRAGNKNKRESDQFMFGHVAQREAMCMFCGEHGENRCLIRRLFFWGHIFLYLEKSCLILLYLELSCLVGSDMGSDLGS